MGKLDKLGKLNKWYKYLILGIIFVSAIVVFNNLGKENTSAQNTNTQNGLVEITPKTTSTDQANNTKTNIDDTKDKDYQDLQAYITEDSSSSNNNGQVLSAESSSSINFTNSQGVAASGVESLMLVIFDKSSGFLGGNQTSVSVADGNGGTKTVAVNSGGAIGGLINLTGGMYKTRPISVEVWARDIKNKVDPTAYAQSSLDSDTYNPGQGYELLSPIQKLWRSAVNLVYIFYILIVVVLAFLILFRSQLGGQEVVTLFNAIPSLIISLLLVYFSYPISAVFVDLITVGSGTVYGVLIGDTAASKGGDAPGAYLYDQNINSAEGINKVLLGDERVDPKTGLQIDDKYVNVWQVFSTANTSPTSDDIGDIVPQDVPLANILQNVIGNIAGQSITDSLLKLVFTFAAFSASLKLFFSLMKAYVYLIVLPMVSPFVFLVAAIPGQTGSIIKQYFGLLAASALSFIAVYAIFLVVIIIARDNTSPGDIIWVPPLLGYSGNQTIAGGGVANVARPLIAYALFISTPLIPDYIYQMFEASTESPFAKNIADSTKGGARTILGFGSLGYKQLQGAMGTTPEAR